MAFRHVKEALEPGSSHASKVVFSLLSAVVVGFCKRLERCPGVMNRERDRCLRRLEITYRGVSVQSQLLNAIWVSSTNAA